MFTRTTLLVVVLLGSAPASSFGTIHTVRQDGTGDFTSIQGAVAVASAGDTVEVGPGTYNEGVTVSVALTIRSADGSAATIIEDAPAWVITAGPSRVEGLNFRNMWDPGRGLEIEGAQAIVSDCEFYNNRAPEYWIPGSPDTGVGWGGGAYVENGAVVEFIRCRFDDNFASEGGAAAVTTGSHVTLRQCEIVNNTGWGNCAGVGVKDATLDVVDCLFAGNFSKDTYEPAYPSGEPGGLNYQNSTGSVSGSTFYLNTRDDIKLQASTTVPVERCIFFSEPSQFHYAITYYYDPGPRSCNIFWESRIWNDVLKPDESEVDPLLCDPESGDFSVSVNSPATPEQSPCGLLIGAFEPGCGLTPVAVRSFVARPVEGGVELSWDVLSDEPLEGYRIYRQSAAGQSAVKIHSGLIGVGQRSFVDRTANGGYDYWYTLAVVSGDGTEMRSTTVAVTTPVADLELDQNVPNPFNPSTTISFILPNRVHARLSVYDARGELVRTLTNQPLEAGRHVAEWDGNDRRGEAVGSGVYFYQLQAGNKLRNKKMLLLK